MRDPAFALRIGEVSGEMAQAAAAERNRNFLRDLQRTGPVFGFFWRVDF